MKNQTNKSTAGSSLIALIVVLGGLFVGITGFLSKQDIDTFNRSKVPIEIIKIEQFEQVYHGKSGNTYQVQVYFNYLDQNYKMIAVISKSDYQNKDQIQQFPEKMISLYFSPLTKQVYSQSALEQYAPFISKTGFYFTMLYALGSLIISWLIMLKALK